MYFQISPVRSLKPTTFKIDDLDDEVPTLLLAPFTPIPKLAFECKVDKEQKIKLNIKNPKPNPLNVNVYFDGPETLDVFFKWQEKCLDGSSDETLEILWKPQEEYSARHSLKITSEKKTWNVPLGFKATSQKKPISGLKKKKPVSVTLVKKPPISKTPPNNRKLIQKASIPKVIMNQNNNNNQTNKENIDSNNIPKDGFLSPTNITFDLDQSVNDRRCTYAVQNPRLPLINVEKSPNLEQLWTQQTAITPLSSETFQPRRCSTEMQLKVGSNQNNFDNFNSVKHLTFDEQNMANLSSSTRILENLSFDKVFSSSTYSALREHHSELHFQPTSTENLLCLDGLSAINEEFEFEKPSVKRKSDATFNLSPPKKQILCTETWMRSPCVRSVPRKRVFIEPRNSIVKDPFILATTLSVDPFLSNATFLNENWMEMREIQFKNWFNKLLAPPSELNVNDDTQRIDIAKIWKQSANVQETSMNMTKEQVCNKYHNTSSKLNILRKSARKFYESDEIQSVLTKISNAIEMKKLEIRPDKNIHLDLNLQSNVMFLFLSYNYLWLRIGLETIYGEKLQLNSNSDVVNLSRFLHERFFKDPRLMRKYKTVHNPKYTTDIKKFMLRKFLELVYFLDKAKISCLIQHDPCLFRKNSKIKESREMLIQFTRDAITAGVGDINKYLKLFGYIVQHKQVYIHEFDFSVNNLGGDLRDGVRLMRVMEIILMKTNLMVQLRVPAISRLQKVHNVKLVFQHLNEAGFEIMYEIEPHHIVDGHREKTLSFLWQIIHKFHAPYIVKNVRILQSWWRSLPVMIKRKKLTKIYTEKIEAVVKIQRWYKCKILQRKLRKFTKCLHIFLKQRKREKAAILIQSLYKMRVERMKFLNLKAFVIKLQTNYKKKIETRKLRAVITIQKNTRMFLTRRKYVKLKISVVTIENFYVAYKKMLVVRQDYLTLKASATIIQTWYKATVLMREACDNYSKLKSAVLFVQRKYRAKKEMEVCRNNYKSLLELNHACKIIQRRYKANKAMQNQRLQYLKLKKAVRTIENRYRSWKLMLKERQNFLRIKRATISIQNQFRMRIQREVYLKQVRSCITIQKFFRGYITMKNSRENFSHLKLVVLKIQRRFRAKKIMEIQRTRFFELKHATIKLQSFMRMKCARNKFLMLKNAVQTIQKRYRAKKSMEKCRQEYVSLRNATICIQRKLVAHNLMKIHREKFLDLKRAAIKLQSFIRMKRARSQFLTLLMNKQRAEIELKSKVVFIQRKFRAKRSMLKCKHEYAELKNATKTIQNAFRAKILMETERTTYLKLKQSTVTIQKYFRGFLQMKIERKRFLELKSAVLKVQRKFRAERAMLKCRNDYVALKNATKTIQNSFRAKKSMKTQRASYLKLQIATIKIQKYYRGFLCMKKQRDDFQKLKKIVVLVQSRFRARKLMKTRKNDYETLRNATVRIQRKFIAKKQMKTQRTEFLIMKNATIKIQQNYRARKLMKKQRDEFERLKSAVILIQRIFRGKLNRREYFEIRKGNAVKFVCNIPKERLYFLRLKLSVIRVEQKYIANKLMRNERNIYHCQKVAAVKIQAHFRCYLLGFKDRKSFLLLKTTVLKLQKRYRSKKLTEKCKGAFDALKKATLLVQRKFRANQLMKIERMRYLVVKTATCKIQRFYRSFKMMKRESENFLKVKHAVNSLQKFARGYLTRKKYGNLLSLEAREARRLKKKREHSATRIQAAWKGYKQRKESGARMQEIRENLVIAQNEANPQNTLSHRTQKALKIFLTPNLLTKAAVVEMLKDFDYLTRRSKEICEQLGPIIPEHLYLIMKSIPRSLPDREIHTYALLTLINLFKYPVTSALIWFPDNLDGMLSIMLHWCDKEDSVFSHLCTLFWLFAQKEEYRQVIQNIPTLNQKLDKIKDSVLRKQKMVMRSGNKVFMSRFYPYSGKLSLPGTKADWGIDYANKPRVFTHSVHAMESLVNILMIS